MSSYNFYVSLFERLSDAHIDEVELKKTPNALFSH